MPNPDYSIGNLSVRGKNERQTMIGKLQDEQSTKKRRRVYVKHIIKVHLQFLLMQQLLSTYAAQHFVEDVFL